ncbi:MAG: carboxypeptidase regulatory-like domain-containing protein [Hydrogenophilaceae bacterium]|nr:carboxypeptidase regulatory-like domain-containing protein [Hydrogenophilaceae bacterium]
MKTARQLASGLLFLLMLAASAAAFAQTVRGQVVRWTPYGNYPAAYVAVTLLSPQLGRSAPAYSTPDGFYFLYNVPPGQYVLEVWAYQQAPITMPVVVFPAPLTDIPPVTIR